MENKLQKASTSNLSLEIKEMGIELFQYNQLTAFPISDAQIIDWAKTFSEVAPNLTPAIMHQLINRMKVGTEEFDSRLGVQNIFNAYRKFLNKEIEHIARDVTRSWDASPEKQEISRIAEEKCSILRKQFNDIFHPEGVRIQYETN